MTGEKIEKALQKLLDEAREHAGSKLSHARYAFYMPPKMFSAYGKHLNFGKCIREDFIESYVVEFCGYRVYPDAKMKKDIIALKNREAL